ncbi:hypothetical protein LshimejAT787_0305540 [Lyophyllum shimeji]|uniref:DUF6697 domain-containing protein n=1 Tax=Lyophyllum shimeji TaxID=47721 RepID=A0A9P3UMF5_LYOSH|nr:hypothetical protein LshimejAT787_0305540 [Lyophyllum shimeji]
MEGFQGALPGTDEAFWSSVVKRWSDACETVVSLRRELKEAQEESRCHQQSLRESRARETELLRQQCELKEECRRFRGDSESLLQEKAALLHSQTQSTASGQPDGNPADKTRDADREVERVNHECSAIKEQLSVSREKILALNNEIKALQEEKKTIEENNCVLTQTNVRLETELTRSRSEYDALKAELQELGRQNQQLRADCLVHTQQLEDLTARLSESESQRGAFDAEFAARSEELRTLKSAATVYKQEISSLRDELVSLRDKLSKSSDTNKTLLDNFTKLNAKLREQALAHGDPQTPRHPPPTALKEEGNSAGLNAQDGRAGSRMFIGPATSPLHDKTPSTSQAALQQTTVQATSPWPVSTPIPDARQQSLAELVQYVPDIDPVDCRFRRGLLASAIGGGIQSLIVRATQSRTELAKSHNISTYLCPALELNPWCPTSPGQHGYMFVGLGQERTTFQEPQAGLNLFVGYSRCHGRPKEYRYLGVYTAVRVANLTVGEWNTLSGEVKYSYASTTKDKNKDPRSVEQILAAYDKGQLTVPCVRLQCTDYNDILYASLSVVAAQLTPAEHGPSPSRSTRVAGKRRRDDLEPDQASSRTTRRATLQDRPRAD